jgi:ubiquinone biosynthesis protein COQ9
VLWNSIASNPDKVALARALIERVPLWGWGEAVLSTASEAVFDDLEKWRRIFPRGSRDAIWFISEVSDASMKLPFLDAPAPSMSTVIITRLDQNRHLKPFVRKVMLFDVLHPFQALSRMQRTSRVMFACTDRTHRAASYCSVAGLNVLYTAVVLIWLFDGTDADDLTKRLARLLVRLVGMS